MNHPKVNNTLILGAGPAGMAAAMELHKARHHVHVVEKDIQVGGLAKTLTYEEDGNVFRTDIGPHRFYSKNPYLYAFIADLLHEKWQQVPRCTRFYIGGIFYHYPIRFTDVLKKIGLWNACCILHNYLYERARKCICPRTLNSFEDYVVSTFGRRLAEFNMLNYTEKIWGVPCNQISIDWAKQRIGNLSVIAAIKKMFIKCGGPKSLVDIFYYPSHGTGLIYEAIKNKLLAGGHQLSLQSEPVVIHHENNAITSVTINTPQGEQTLYPAYVVNSIPITRCIQLFSPPPPQNVIRAAQSLRFRSQVYLFLTVNKPSISKDNWIYFPDKEIPFGRISEMRNFSSHMCPDGMTSLFVEFFCFKGDEIWNASKEELFEMSISTFEKMNFFMRQDVRNIYLLKKEHVYPIYDLDYAEHVQTVLEWTDSFSNFYTIGRPGRFRYTNQDHSLEMGIHAAACILNKKKWQYTFGKEDEYFEQGYVPKTVTNEESTPPQGDREHVATSPVSGYRDSNR
ncbi:hypothetical protein A3D11_03590 [Candidatus Peribacteria bacterium RIFCSPHIGHO2_02_FULL_49_16]|nr:MAG: hypothetical protein A2880_04550 [Candidatus Peribacteria bacterium RIFCSPHIGHO2_01_FULL_49_38]OGJ58816.1 MAG: hypothetical protein A3D11_03590 [Candidatus Peribacteria bacterium RIFCSPHIGHO2_02_FULL_49_16]